MPLSFPDTLRVVLCHLVDCPYNLMFPVFLLSSSNSLDSAFGLAESNLKVAV